MLVGTPRSRSEEEKILPLSRFFFAFSCTLCIRTLFSVLVVLRFAFCLLLTTQTSMPPAGFEPANPANDRR
jgi:hypothetical protein